MAPGYQVADFEEYCALYREAWSEPTVRWLLSVLPTIMVFDDHDVHDDWNTSAAWREEFRAKPWWPSRITGAYTSYWVYQHLGNLSPAELGRDNLWRRVLKDDDAAAVLRELALNADAQRDSVRWSVRRDFGRVRVVVIDSRSRRMVGDDRHRLMIDQAEWEWVTAASAGDVDHLVLATSVPLLLPLGIHYLEAWNEAVCAGAWGRWLRAAGERLRQAVDLEHWAAFGASFAAFEKLLTERADPPAGPGPASVTVISGDIHHHYLARVELAGAAVYQAVCSPIHNAMSQNMRLAHRLITSRLGEAGSRSVARLAGVRPPRLRWRMTDGPWFANMLAELSYDGRAARIRFDRTVAGPARAADLEPASQVELTAAVDRVRQ